ncbi:site-specific integrase [Reinekea blandensis]|uniref:site-specific integrase n=1 Tax=Reinekea blandensis TaxID=374838 RepID=UPI001375B4F4|nr:site-specific integrase [Reinekea blandensis]
MDYKEIKQRALQEAQKAHADWLTDHFNGVDLEVGNHDLPESPYDSEYEADSAAMGVVQERLTKGTLLPDEVEIALSDLLYYALKRQTLEGWNQPKNLLESMKGGSFRDVRTSDEPFNALVEDFIEGRRLKNPGTKASTHQEYVDHVNEFWLLMNKPALSAVDNDLADQYLKNIQQLPKHSNSAKYKGKSPLHLISMDLPQSDRLSGTSINNRISHLSSYCEWLIRQGKISSDPFSGMTVVLKDKQPYAPFSHEDIKRILSSKLYNHSHPKFITGNRRSNWWLILIAVFSGMRLAEITQLTVDDLREEDGVYFFSINREEGKTVKNKNAERAVPVHSFLLDLGLLEYASYLRKENIDMLLPNLLSDRKKPGDGSSRWFNEKYRSSEFPDFVVEKKVFHSFRKTFFTTCSNKDPSVSYRAVLQEVVGHENQKAKELGSSATYMGGFELPLKAKAVELFTFDGIDHVRDRLKGKANWRQLKLP